MAYNNMVVVEQKGQFKKTTEFLNFLSRGTYLEHLAKKYGQKGVDALSAATPVDTGKTAASWSYEYEMTPGGMTIRWLNSNLSNDWFPIALYLQYGHATRGGGWVEGTDYINPAMRPIFEEMSREMWKEVTEH